MIKDLGMILPRVSACACAGLLAATVRAQEAPVTSPAEGLEEVVVTANKRPEFVQQVPYSVQAFTAASLEALHIEQPSDLSKFVPGLDINIPYGDGAPPNFVMRGISATDYTFTQARPIALYTDGAVRQSMIFEALSFFDVDRIEVLKGPQGTLYGKNATGGAINIISVAPGFDTDGYITVGYGNFERREAKGAAQTALMSDVLAVRFAFDLAKDDGQVKNLYPGVPNEDQTDVQAARLSFLLNPTQNIDALLRLSYNFSGGTNYSVYAADVNPALTAGVTRAGLSFLEEQTNRPTSKRLENYGLNAA